MIRRAVRPTGWRGAAGRVLRIAVVVGIGTITVVAPDPGVGAAAQVTEVSGGQVTLSGGGEDLSAVTNAWADALETPTGISFDISRNGSKAGRADFVAGTTDFALSGRPLAASDLQQLAARKTTAITAPVAVTGLSLVYGTRSGQPLRKSLQDPWGFDPVTYEPVTGPLHIPAAVIARTVLNVQATPLESDPDFTAAFAPYFLAPESEHPYSIVRSDPDSSNFYLQQFVQRTPIDQIPGLAAPVTPSEEWPITTFTTPTKQGEDQVAGALLARQAGTAGGGVNVPLIVGMSPARTAEAIAESQQPGQVIPSTLYPIAVQNGLGEWVQATPDSLTKAAAGAWAAASGGAPLWGLAETTPDVSGAYPLSWIANISFPAGGMDPAKTTAAATLLRYVATQAGQDAAAAAGFGRLPLPALAATQAAADQVVAANCTGADRKVATVADGGPYWPKGVTPPASATVCNALVTAGTTTTAVPPATGSTTDGGYAPPYSAGGGSYRSSPYSSGSYSSGSPAPIEPYVSGETEVAGAAAPDRGSLGGQAGPAASASTVAATLPLPLPDDGRSTLDRLMTMVLGGAACLLARGAFRRRGRPA